MYEKGRLMLGCQSCTYNAIQLSKEFLDFFKEDVLSQKCTQLRRFNIKHATIHLNSEFN